MSTKFDQGSAKALEALNYKLYPSLQDDVETIRVLNRREKGRQLALQSLVIDKFEKQAAANPKKEFLIFEDNVFTYEFVDQMACKVANIAKSWGLKAGQNVAIMMENEPAFVWTFLGLQKMGISVALINHNLRLQPLQHSILATQPSHLIVGADKTLLQAVTAILDKLKPHNVQVWAYGLGFDPPPSDIHSLDPLLLEALTSAISPVVRRGISTSDVCCYIFTSGTTGNPKPVKVSQGRANALCITLLAVSLNSSDRLYIVLPLYHTVGLGIGLFSAIFVGATVVLSRKFSASHFWSDCRRHDATVFLYIGELFRYLLAQPQSELDSKHSVRAVYGNGLRRDIWSEVERRFRIPQIMEFFGATEGTSLFLNATGKPGAVGRLSPLLSLYNDDKALVRFDYATAAPLRDKNGRCMKVNIGEPGLCLSIIPPNVLENGAYRIYHGPSSNNEKKMARDVFQEGDVYFNFGDVLVMDKDYWVYFHDRIGDTFRWKGENVSTLEVSNVMTSLSFVYDVYVYGVKVPGHDGKAGMAAVTMNKGQSLGPKELLKLYDHVMVELPNYARPLFLRNLGQPVITNTFKQRKVELIVEGYDQNVITDPLFFLDHENSTYSTLTQGHLSKLLSSKL
ncbi:long-chain fatty acid transport protein 6 [Aplysia californica]|uniref:Long-chain-fatty-acid--CoA ligase n=1 Tax=Aplysia californica TaxID=6500 RepID=A0ABM1VTS2_APLCA|nr:long-chain fatty acid transport protein 6 [Aplysia californica]